MDRDKYSKIRNSISWNNSCDTIKASDIVLSKYGSTWASLLLQQQVYLVSSVFIIIIIIIIITIIIIIIIIIIIAY